MINLYNFKVIANRYYNNIDLDPSVKPISDQKYDEWVKEYGRKPYDLLVSMEGKIPNDNVETTVVKYSDDKMTYPELVRYYLRKFNETYVATYKYDGSAIRAEYRDGLLFKILSTPDEPTCLDVTEKFRKYFPEKVFDSSVRYLRGELITDPKLFGYLARNKANGLITSKYLADDIEKYAKFRIYDIIFTDGKYDFVRLFKYLDTIEETDHLKVAEHLNVSTDIPTSPIVVSPTGDSVLVDGMVIYGQTHKYAIKFYFNEIKETEITGIDWNYNVKNFSYTPKFRLKPVVVDGKDFKAAATGGVPAMKKVGGIGTTVYVIAAKMTVPKIYDEGEFEPRNRTDNYGNLTCECGTVMDISKDLYGSNLRCPNIKCSRKLESMRSRISKTDWEYNLKEVLGIDRLKVDGLTPDQVSVLSNLHNIELNERITQFEDFMRNNFNLSELQLRLLKLNSYAFCSVI